MISSAKFVSQSLELHLFFARIMKEHAFFLQAGFAPKNVDLIKKADDFRRAFDFLLAETVTLSNGVVSKEVMESGEIITPYTLKAETASAYFTGVDILTGITLVEGKIKGRDGEIALPLVEPIVYVLNEKIKFLLSNFIAFKREVFSKVTTCKIFTWNYPSLVEHVLHEAEFYLRMIEKLQGKEDVDVDREEYEQEEFWNHIMGEHAKTIRGMLDPSEEELIKIADNFGDEFDELNDKTKQVVDRILDIDALTEESLEVTEEFHDFKVQAVEGILQCEIKSIIIPLLADHVLREANHYLRLLNTFKENM